MTFFTGYAQWNGAGVSKNQLLNDPERVGYLHDYLAFLSSAMRYLFFQINKQLLVLTCGSLPNIKGMCNSTYFSY